MRNMIITRVIVLLSFSLLFCSCSLFKEKVEIVTGMSPGKENNSVAVLLQDYLNSMYHKNSFIIVEEPAGDKAIFLTLADGPSISQFSEEIRLPKTAEGYVIQGQASIDNGEQLVICGYDSLGLIYGVYDFLELLGCRFYLSQEFIPEKEEKIALSSLNQQNEPVYNTRIIFNWHNFLSGCSGWDFEEYKRWVDGAVSQKYNAIMVHAYGNNPMYRFNFNGLSKPSGYIPNTVRGRDWGTNHVNDIRNLYGGERFSDPVFGADVSKVPEDMVEQEAVSLMQKVFRYADERSIDVIFGFDIATGSANPQTLLNTLPEGSRLYNHFNHILANPETEEGYRYFKSHIEGLLGDYPQIDYLVPWVRYMFPSTSANYFTIKELPGDWDKEYRSILNKHPELREDPTSNSIFYIGKIIQAYEKILQEIGRTDIKIGLGTWNWFSFPIMDKFVSDNVSFFPLDWYTNFVTDSVKETLLKIDPDRRVYPVVWAHHDDHSHIGRPFTPPSEFAVKLAERHSEGFGIIHWNTWPLDLYFKNLSQQTWKQSINEGYEKTILDYAKNAVGSGDDEFNDYLKTFYTEAPHFGRETSNYFYDIFLNEAGQSLLPVYNPDTIIMQTRDRLERLDRMKEEVDSQDFMNTYLYYCNLEAFFLLFFENQKLLIEAVGFVLNGDYHSARKTISKTNPEEAIAKYAEAIGYGPATTGEKAIIISLNLNWLPDFIDIRQKTRLIPVSYKFYPTQHEPLASGSGTYTYYFDKDKQISVCLGAKETNGGKVFDETGGYLLLTDSLVNFSLGHWRKVPPTYPNQAWTDNRLIEGKYILELEVTNLPEIKADSDFYVELRNDQGKLLNGEQQIFRNRDALITIPFHIDHSHLNISLKNIHGSLGISSLTIVKENWLE